MILKKILPLAVEVVAMTINPKVSHHGSTKLRRNDAFSFSSLDEIFDVIIRSDLFIIISVHSDAVAGATKTVDLEIRSNKVK